MNETAAIIAACTGALTSAVGFVRALNRHVASSPTDPMSPIWNTRKLQDDTWAVVTRDQVADLGIDEDTVYGGYTYVQALAVAKWLNDGGDDRRALADVLRDVEESQRTRVEEVRQPAWGGNFLGPTVEERIRLLSKRIAGSMAVPPAMLGQRLFGVMTRDDILAFQRALQLKADGVLGPVTTKAIHELIQRETQPPDRCGECEAIYEFGSSKPIGCTCGQVHVADNEPQRFVGDGSPSQAIGSSPGDRYIDRTTGDTYIFDVEVSPDGLWHGQPPVLRQALRRIWAKQADHLSRPSPTRGEKR